MYIDDMKIGTVYDLGSTVIEKEKMMEFARLYDPLPFHCDEEYAKSTRYGGLIAPGVMAFMSVWSNIAKTDFFGNELIGGKSTKIEWLLPVYPGDVLTGKAVLTKITPRNPYNGIAEMTVTAYNQKGELVLTDVTESIIKYRKSDEK